VKEDEALLILRSATATANNREAAAFALSDGSEFIHSFFTNSQNVSLLCLTTPDLHRAHASVGIINLAKLKRGPEARVMDQLRKGIRQTASTDVVNKCDGVVGAHGHTRVDNFLGSALHLG